ncbi:MAG: class I SAM-dependent methyltransferase [Clostridium sp.]
MLKYSIISKFYDLLDVFYFKNNENNPRKKMAKIIPNEKINILEICIGTGSNTIAIKKENPKVNIIGIDLSQDMLNIANEKFEKLNMKNIKTILMDGTKLKFNNEEFDFAVISLVLHEVPEEVREGMLKESYRVLKRGGTLLILEWEVPKDKFRRSMFKIIELMEPKGFKDFLNLNYGTYLNKYNFKIKGKYSCDYSKVIEIIK